MRFNSGGLVKSGADYSRIPLQLMGYYRLVVTKVSMAYTVAGGKWMMMVAV
jgi:hypothetical protein